MQARHFDRFPAEMSDEEFAAVADELRNDADTVAVATFGRERPTETVAVCFCGVNERFRTISLLRQMRTRSVICQDPLAPWFTGSTVCEPIVSLTGTLQNIVPDAHRWLVFGQSSGGYAALYASRLLPECAAVAFSPQTFDDRLVARQIGLPLDLRKAYVQADITDLREPFSKGSSRNAAIIFSSIDEEENPRQSFVWLDHMHWSRLLDFSWVRVLLLETRNHSLLYRKGGAFAAILQQMTELPAFGVDSVAGFLVEETYHRRQLQRVVA